jgi:hypothetical protein
MLVEGVVYMQGSISLIYSFLYHTIEIAYLGAIRLASPGSATFNFKGKPLRGRTRSATIDNGDSFYSLIPNANLLKPANLPLQLHPLPIGGYRKCI